MNFTNSGLSESASLVEPFLHGFEPIHAEGQLVVGEDHIAHKRVYLLGPTRA